MIDGLTGEVWVETPADGGKAYYYNVRTRVTSWKRPQGNHVKILTQQEMDKLTQKLISEEEEKVIHRLEDQRQQRLDDFRAARDINDRLEIPTCPSDSDRHHNEYSPLVTAGETDTTDDEVTGGGGDEEWTEEDARKLKEMEAKLASIERREKEIERKKRQLLEVKRQSKSPKPGGSRSPVPRESKSPPRRSPIRPPPRHSKSRTPGKLTSPTPGRSRSPPRRRSRSPPKRHSKSRTPGKLRSPTMGRSRSPPRRRSRSPRPRQSKSPTPGKSMSPDTAARAADAAAAAHAKKQAIIIMCRLYVGSINFVVTEKQIREIFRPFGPISDISMSWDPITQKHKGFAFVNYKIPEAAQLALAQMQGAIIGGRQIKVGKPTISPQAQIIIDEIKGEAEDNRIYIASIHEDFTKDDMKCIFEAFGTITSCELAMSVLPGRHEGYGFLKYESAQSAQEAIAVRYQRYH